LAAQLPLPFETASAFDRDDFVVAAGNAEAVAFVDSWPGWPAPAAALFGPSGSGKSHLVHAWAKQSGGAVLDAAQLTFDAVAALDETRPAAVDNIGTGIADESALFALFQDGRPLLLAGREPPAAWHAALPDLRSRFAALLAFPLWAPDDALLAALARKRPVTVQLVGELLDP